MADFGLLEGKTASEAAAAAAATLRMADKEGAGALGRAAFAALYDGLVANSPRHLLRARLGAGAEGGCGTGVTLG